MANRKKVKVQNFIAILSQGSPMYWESRIGLLVKAVQVIDGDDNTDKRVLGT